MGLFDVGPLELVVIFVVTLLVFGPERLPEILGQLGRWVRTIRRMADDVTREFTRELNLDDANRSPYPYQPPLPPPPPYVPPLSEPPRLAAVAEQPAAPPSVGGEQPPAPEPGWGSDAELAGPAGGDGAVAFRPASEHAPVEPVSERVVNGAAAPPEVPPEASSRPEPMP
ncbi:MAG: hypothetical protein KatS3mg061_1243 [Dehalococcoidia bacterium]|nr:MAG: hypothetical protein KatS3mg061_1243 [Dehalococcoidia bacterium]